MTGIGWFSGGVTSAVAIKKALESGKKMQIFYFETGAHHSDHVRFKADCEKWFGQEIIIARNKKYADLWDVLSKHKHMNGPYGADCTRILKKEVRQIIEKVIDFDFQVFGFEFTPREIKRSERFLEQYPEAKAIFPLIETKITKKKALELLVSEGIEIPAAYKLGLNNSNCLPCVKGGAGYFNHIRKIMPEAFDRMAKLERINGRYLLKGGKFLDELDPEAGRHEPLELPECGVVCQIEMMGVDT